MRPYYLDGDRTKWFGDTRTRSLTAIANFCGYCAVFKDRRRLTPAVMVTVSRKREVTRQAPVSQSSTACRPPMVALKKTRRKGAKAGQVRSTC